MAYPIDELLSISDGDLEDRWAAVLDFVHRRFGRQEAGIDPVLFLIGIQSRGRGFEPNLEKEVKQSLIMEGSFCALAAVGMYERVGIEHDGAWIWERVGPEIPALGIDDQERLLKIAIVRYFDEFVSAGSL
jgi:hypothetical protein